MQVFIIHLVPNGAVTLENCFIGGRVRLDDRPGYFDGGFGLGTILACGSLVKVKWDNGAPWSSYNPDIFQLEYDGKQHCK